MNNDYNYFEVLPNSEVMQRIDAALERTKAFTAAALEFQRKIGAGDSYTSGGRITSVTFNGDVPTGWRESSKHTGYVPNLKTKEGRQYRKEMEALPTGVCDSWSIGRALGFLHISDGHWYSPGLEKLLGKWIVAVHKGCEKQPDRMGCRLMKPSEYWAMKEATLVDMAEKGPVTA